MPDPIDWGFALPYYLLALALGYGLGSIPTSVLLSKFFGFSDARGIGSGNIGATNALRTGSRLFAALTLAGDSFKAGLAVWLASTYGPQSEVLAAAGALLGHLYPVWLKFKGGKGIAVYLGALLVLDYRLALVFIIVWGGTAALTRFSSAAALLGAAALIPAAIALDLFPLRDLSIFFFILIVVSHRENIIRLWQGTESKIGGGEDG